MKTIIVIIAIIALGATGYYGFTIYKEKAHYVKDVIAISNAEMEELAMVFLKTVSNQDIDGVYTMVTDGFKTNIPRDELSSFITAAIDDRKFKGLRSIGFSYSKIDVETGQKDVYKKDWIYEYSGIITFDDDSERKTHVLLMKEGGQWKVHYFDFAKENVAQGAPDNSVKDIKAISNAEMEQIVAAFLKTLSNMNIDGVYKLAIERFETALPRAKLSSFVTTAFGKKKLRELRNNGFSYSKRYFENEQQGIRTEHWVYIYSGIMTFTDNSERELDIALRREGGQWKVQHIEIEPR